MIDNSQDKGYIAVKLKAHDGEVHLCKMGYIDDPEEDTFYVDYEDGHVFVVNGEQKTILGTYETVAPDFYGIKVFDYVSKRVIAYIREDQIYFCKKGVDYDAGIYNPETKMLAYVYDNGSIKSRDTLDQFAAIYGSEVGAVAAFVALIFNYAFKSMFRDYYIMDKYTFEAKYNI